jgi:Peptidase family M1 domain/Chitobiase/beta-hexosaminidase C-terminal domain
MRAVSRRNARATIALGAVLAAAVLVPSFKAANAAADPPGCVSGAHSLSSFGSRLYPEMGNGGYTSLHTDLFLNYDAIANMFLPGTHADLQVHSTQCLSDLSFDFEQTNGHTADGTGPNMSVGSVQINGTPATFAFVQPTYPGDPNGQNDPDPAAHAVSNANPVSATNPNPPACSPQVNNTTQNGTPCPANKLVVTPSTPIPDGTTVTVTINYTGRPGVHTDGDGSTEGWFRIATAGSEGAFVTTEPVGNDSWMPMNNYPTAKPTYDIYDTTNIGKVAIGPGELVGYSAPVGATYQPVPAPASNAPDANFPLGSVTWHWHSPEPIASYLVENSIGAYDLSARTSPTSGVQYWEAQASTITAAKKATNKTAMDNQEDIVNFQTRYNGPWPLTTDGIVVGTPSASFEEEMQGKITFAGGSIGPALGTFNHENMHQWFGDNVSEAAFNLTWWKEGFATIGEYLATARTAATTAGGLDTPAGDAAFENSLIGRFNGTGNYNTTSTTFWTQAPNNPSVNSLFTTAFTYTRSGTAYLGLWRALGKDRMISAMKDIQSTYGGGTITQPQLEAVFRKWLPTPSASCNARLTQFYAQWWNTSYPSGGANTLNRPMLTGPGLNGQGFPCAKVTPVAPNGQNGWYTSNVDVDWSGFPTPAATITATRTGCGDTSGHQSFTTDGTFTPSCEVSSTVTATSANAGTSGPISETIKRDATAPTTTASVAPPSPDLLNGWYGSAPTVTLTPADGTSGLASTKYTIDGGAPQTYSAPFAITTEGSHTIQYWSTDNAGNQESPSSLTVKLDLNAPVTTATLTPGIHNGWYASPTLTLAGDDGAGSGIDHISYSRDGGLFQTYAGPLSGFTTGNHFVQYRSTDNAGRLEAVKLIAFKVDADKPTVNIARPKAGADFKLGQVVTANYKCADKNKGSGMDTCVGTVASGHAIDTSSVGDHTFTVTGTDKAGNVTTVVHSYHVRGPAVRAARLRSRH